MEVECRNKIEELHRFIESWLMGSVKKSKQVFKCFDDELDTEFVIIHPSSQSQNKSEISNDLWGAHGVQNKDFSIEIRNIRLRCVIENICIMNYEEWQSGVEKSVRISTVVFRKFKGNDKIYWFHLHETWRSENG